MYAKKLLLLFAIYGELLSVTSDTEDNQSNSQEILNQDSIRWIIVSCISVGSVVYIYNNLSLNTDSAYVNLCHNKNPTYTNSVKNLEIKLLVTKYIKNDLNLEESNKLDELAKASKPNLCNLQNVINSVVTNTSMTPDDQKLLIKQHIEDFKKQYTVYNEIFYTFIANTNMLKEVAEEIGFSQKQINDIQAAVEKLRTNKTTNMDFMKECIEIAMIDIGYLSRINILMHTGPMFIEVGKMAINGSLNKMSDEEKNDKILIFIQEMNIDERIKQKFISLLRLINLYKRIYDICHKTEKKYIPQELIKLEKKYGE